MSERQPLVALCPRCQQPMALESVVEEQSEKSPRIEVLACAAGHGKVAVIFEMSDGRAPTDEAFVHREVARRGAFFPSDYTGSGRHWR